LALGAEPEGAAPASDTVAPEPATPDPEPADPKDDVWRRRTGFAALVGSEVVKDDFGNRLGATMYGGEVRLGVQLDDHFGVQVPLHFSYGAFKQIDGSVLGVPAGATGTLSATVLADYTWKDRLFVGAGGGVVVLNNPTGPAIHLRAGGYPLVGRTKSGERRRGLSVAGDLRLVYGKGFSATIPSVSIGFDSF
jgi:hypothetical protein